MKDLREKSNKPQEHLDIAQKHIIKKNVKRVVLHQMGGIFCLTIVKALTISK